MNPPRQPSRVALFLRTSLVIGLLLLSIAGAWARPPGKRLLLFVGSNTLGERAVPELAKVWLETQKKATNVTIVAQGDPIYVSGRLPGGAAVYVEIHATGSGDCFQSFLGLFPQADAPCDIGMSSRAINEQELAAILEKTGSDFSMHGREPGQGCEHPVALDGIAIIVHKSNPLSRLSFGELRAIYSRKATDWKQLAEWKDSGGAPEGGAIAPVRRKEPSGTLDFFKQRIRPDAEPMSDLTAIPAFASSSELTEKVAAIPGGIGFVGQSYALHPGVKRLQIYDDSPQTATTPDQAVFPDPSAVRQELYPLTRVVYLYTPIIRLNPEVQSFLQFALSEQGQTIIVDRGGLVKIEGTAHEISARANAENSGTSQAGGDGRKKQVILRLHGSNTVGAECAVNLAFNYFMNERQKKNSAAKIDDVTTPIETPEGEKALIHAVMCDLEKDGVPETIEIRPTGSGDAFKAMKTGLCDVGMSSRPISDAERRDLLPVCGDLSRAAAQYGLGLDAIAIIVPTSSKVEQLTLEQVRRIFHGEIIKWSDVGGEDRPIQLHSRPDRSGTYKYFCDSVLLGLAVPDSAKRHPENFMVSAAVAEDPDGIGFVSMSSTGPAKVLKIGLGGASNACTPTEESVRAGRYPAALCRYVYFYVPANPPNSPSAEARHNWETARDFAELSQTWRGQAIVASSGFVTDTAMADAAGKTQRGQGEPILQYLQRLSELERQAQTQPAALSPKLVNGEICPRLLFEFDGWALTAESTNIIDKKLGPWLRIYPAIARGGLIVEGWADSVGSDEACRQVSLQRAETVARYIRDSLAVRVTAVGRGKSFDPPNVDEASKQLNRRVVIKAAPTTFVSTGEATPKPSAKKKKL